MTVLRATFLTALLACAAALQGARAAVWDLAADWSDLANPNGPWTLIDETGAPFSTSVPDWDPSGSTLFGSAQPAWADAPFPSPGHVPMFFRRTSDASPLDVPVGRVGLHTSPGDLPIAIRWTAPISTSISVQAGVWHALHAGVHATRAADFELDLGLLVIDGRRTGSDGFSSATPPTISVSTLSVDAGDVITMSFVSGAGDVETFLGVDLRITSPDVLGADVPEPSTALLVGAALLVVGIVVARGRR